MAKDTKTADPKKKAKDQHHSIIGHRRQVLYIGLGMTFLILVMWFMGIFSHVELGSLDWRFSLRGQRAPRFKMAIVAIDDESLNVWQDDKNQTHQMPEHWTWPRGFYGTVVDNLSKAGAKIIAFDLVYSESSIRDPSQDRSFANACKRAGNVVLSERLGTRDLGGGQTGQKRESLIRPLDEAKRDKGLANAFADSDGYIRGYRVVVPDENRKLVPDNASLDLAVVRQYLWGKPVEPQFNQDDVMTLDGGGSVAPLKILHDGLGKVDINYDGPPDSFPTFKFHDVYYQTMDMSVFKDRIVFIGSTSDILHDNFHAPFTDGDNMPGVETHAELVDTILAHDFLKRYPPYVELLLVLILGVLTSFLTFRVKTLYGALTAVLELTFYLTFVIFVFVGHNVVLPMVAPALAVAAAFLGIAVYRSWVEERRARSTRAMFSRYVSKQIVDEILKNPDAVKLGGEVKEVSILFSDVRGFTAMSEKLSAPQVVEVLNEYLTAMVDIVIANHGTLDKYVGDAIMAVWGSPVADPDHTKNSVRTAVMMMEVLKELQVKWKAEGKPEIDIGIGVHSGHVVAGNMGHPEYKMDYTVIGDDVNLAARLESANKELKAHVLISGAVYEATSSLIDVIKHPDIHVKGKEKAVEVYEVTGWKGQGRAPWAVPLKG
jgi:adenylate cyclase